MALQTVTGKIRNPDGSLGLGADIRFVLSQAVTIPGTEEIVPAVVNVKASIVDATFSVQLQANIDLTPGNTYWTAFVNTGAPGGQATYTPIIVPHGGGEMGNLLGAIPPLTPGPGHVGSLIVDGAATFSSGPVTIGGTLGVTGLASFAGGLTVSAGVVTLPVASIADEALSENVALLNEANVFTAAQVFPALSIPDATLAALAVSKLTGTTLPGSVLNSSLTSVGILAAPHMTAPVVDSGALTVSAGPVVIGAGNVLQLNRADNGATFDMEYQGGGANESLHFRRNSGDIAKLFYDGSLGLAGGLSIGAMGGSGPLVGLTVIGPVIAQTQLANGALQLGGGQVTGGLGSTAQIGFGYNGGGQYRHWISSQHNDSLAVGNKLRFWTSDGSPVGAFPTNAILALTLENGSATVANGLTVSAGAVALPAASIADAALSANVPLKNAANTFSAIQTVPALAATGLTGAVAASRYVGATAFGAPTTGTFLVGDWVISRASGAVIVCTVAGSPGTWNYPLGIFNVLDFGALGDGVTDDGPAFTAAYVAAGPSSGTVLAPAGRSFRIKTSITPIAWVKLSAYGATFGGPITGFSRISSPTTAASGTDPNAQTAGACFAESVYNTTLYGLAFEGVYLSNFRFGIVNRSPWNAPLYTDVTFENCNIGIWAYQGAQNPTLKNVSSVGGAAGTTFVGAATAFPAGHPLSSMDNYFCDGLTYDGSGHQRDGAIINADFDLWFQQSVLQPDTVSVVTGGSFTFGFAAGTTGRNVSGRCIYIPSRNKRPIYSTAVRQLNGESCGRGAVLVGNPYDCDIKNIGGEACFGGTPNTESMVVVLLDNPSVMRGLFSNIDATTAGGSPKASIEVQAAAGSGGRFFAHNISGDIIGRSNFYSSSVTDNSSATKPRNAFTEVRGQTGLGRGAGALVPGGATDVYYMGGDYRRLLDEVSSLEVREAFASAIFPTLPGGINQAVIFTYDLEGFSTWNMNSIVGTLDLIIRRLDTGGLDFAQYLVEVPARLGTNAYTVASPVTIGDTVITPSAGATGAIVAGSKVTIGADSYTVRSATSTTFTIWTPARNNYANGVAIASTGSILRTIVAQANAWVTVTMPGNWLNLVNAIGGAPPVMVTARFTFQGPPR